MFERSNIVLSDSLSNLELMGLVVKHVPSLENVGLGLKTSPQQLRW